jgi:hypothetical protein
VAGAAACRQKKSGKVQTERAGRCRAESEDMEAKKDRQKKKERNRSLL